MFRISQTHMSCFHQQLSQIREVLKSINEKHSKNADDFANIEKSLQLYQYSFFVTRIN